MNTHAGQKRMTKYSALTVTFILMCLLLVNCSQGKPIRIPTTPTVFTSQEMWTQVPARESESENSLELSVKIRNIKISRKPNNIKDPYRITLAITFRNTSEHPIVFKKPRSTGFTGQGLIGFPVRFNDVGIFIQRKDDTAMDAGYSSQFVLEPPATDGFEAYVYHRPDDFIVLESGKVFSYTFTEALPFVHLKGETASTKLPPAIYTLYLRYGNEFIGYQLRVDATPPVNLHYFSDPEAQMVDVNAWVGSLTSNKVEFTIPE